MQKINDRYEFNPKTDELGKGGFGRVFKARDTLLERDVVLKYAEKGNLPDKYSLVKEISRVIDFNHPNLVRYYDAIVKKATNSFGEEVEYQIGVMEFVRDGNLRGYIDNQPREGEILQIVEGVLNGLGYLHDRNLIHRDIKPPNILLNREGNLITPKICDFGISKVSGSEATTLSNVIGTFEYMSPEQLGSNPDQKIRTNSDLWAMGILIYEMFVKDLPFGSRRSGTTDAQIVGNILGKGLPDRINEVPQPFRDVIEACLIKDPGTRPGHVKELLGILKGAKRSTLPVPDLKIKPEKEEIVEEQTPIANSLLTHVPPVEEKLEEEIISPIKEKDHVVKVKDEAPPEAKQKSFKAVEPPKKNPVPWLSVLWLIGSPFIIFLVFYFFDDNNIKLLSDDEESGVFVGTILMLAFGWIVKRKHKQPIGGTWPGLYMMGFSILIEIIFLILVVEISAKYKPFYYPGLLTLILSIVFMARQHRTVPKGSLNIVVLTSFLALIIPMISLGDENESGFLILGLILFVMTLISVIIIRRNGTMSKAMWMGLSSILTVFIFACMAAEHADKYNGCYPLDLDCMGSLWTVSLVALIIVLLIVNANKKLTNSPLEQ